MTSNTLAPARAPQGWIVLLAAVVICAAAQLGLHVFALTFVTHLTFWGVQGVAGRYVTGLTIAAVIGIAAWAAAWFGFASKSHPRLMDRYFLIIVGASLAVGAVFASLLVLPELAARKIAADVAAQRQQIATEDLAFEAALNRAMDGGVMKPGFQRADIAADRARLAEGLRLLETYRQRQDARLAQADQGLQGVAPNPAERALRTQAQSYWQLTDDELRENDAKLADLSRARGWHAYGNRIDFPSAADMNAFNAHQTRIQTLESELFAVRYGLLSARTMIPLRD